MKDDFDDLGAVDSELSDVVKESGRPCRDRTYDPRIKRGFGAFYMDKD